MKVELVGIEALSKFIDALTSKVSNYEIKITTDSFQCEEDNEYRAFIVEVIEQ